LQELEQDKTAVAVFTPSFRDFIAVSWPNTPLSVVATKDPVADYLTENYHVCQILNSGPPVYWYMLRKHRPCPDHSQFARQTGAPAEH